MDITSIHNIKREENTERKMKRNTYNLIQRRHDYYVLLITFLQESKNEQI